MTIQRELPLLQRLNGPAVVPARMVAACITYRDAVRACFAHRRVKGMTQRAVAEHAGLYPSQISDYLSDDDTKREMPARHIPSFECVCGNTFITQWLAMRARLTVLEEVQAERMVA